MTTGFSWVLVPWRGEAHPIYWERNTVHFLSLCPHFTSKKISVGKLQKDHPHPPRILDMSATYQTVRIQGHDKEKEESTDRRGLKSQT